jgi:hypothetical protein
VLAGTGTGWVLGRALELVRGGASRPRVVRHALAGAAVAVVAFGFTLPSFANLAPTMRSLQYQADLADELPGLVQAAGGAAALKRCGNPYTGPFLVPVVAWNLRVHTHEVRLAPQRPAVVFRVKTTRRSRPVPSLNDVGDETTLATGQKWRIVTACGTVGA